MSSSKNTTFSEIFKTVEILDWQYSEKSGRLYIAYKIHDGKEGQREFDCTEIEKYLPACGLCNRIESGIVYLPTSANGVAAYFAHDFHREDAQHLIAYLEDKAQLAHAMQDTFWRSHDKMQGELQTFLNK